MPTYFSVRDVSYDLLQYFSFIGVHPSVQSMTVNDEFFATCTASRNWKPFIIGILAPDNPIDFVPIRTLKKEIRKAPPVPELVDQGVASRISKTGGSKGSSDGGNIVPMEHKPVTVDEQRRAIRDAWTRKSGSPPSNELLALMCAQMWVESGGIYRDGDGTNRVKDVFHPPNYNSFGYHDVGAMPPTYKATLVGDPNYPDYHYWEDDNGNRWEPNGKIINNDGTIGMMRAGQLYFAPQSGNSTLERVGGRDGQANAFYTAIGKPGKRFLGTDREGGRPYISSYKAFSSNDEAVNEFISYLYSTFPDVANATTPEEYEHAIMNGVVQGGVTRKFHDPSERVRKIYEEGLTRGVDAYNRKYGRESSGSMSGGSGGADATDDPSQKIMAYGSSFDLDDPLGPVFGRNIEADVVRHSLIRTKMQGLKLQLDMMKRIPPLVLLVSPQEFKRSHENMVDFGVKTRVGNIVHTFLEQPMKINASGVSSAQYAVYADMSGGLTNYNRIHSLSYRNLLSLIMLYRNNGMLYDFQSGLTGFDEESFGSSAGDGSIMLPGSMFIYYDDHVYVGSFDSFNVIDDANKPHNLAYSFTFTVRYDIHVDIGADAQMTSLA